MSKHTPRPWHVSDLHVIGEDRGVAVAICGMGRSSKMKANANLIAAAPDLLEACCNYVYGRKDDRECESDMRAAIAKAKGEA